MSISPMLHGELDYNQEVRIFFDFSPALHSFREEFKELDVELKRAVEWPPYNSAHEGLGVILEEFEELKEHVFLNQRKRIMSDMRKEALQLAATAIRFAHDICNEEAGRR